ncbi:MAG: ABC transporter permease [Inquilinus sp.]|nr:ABC transporter permease [Inquilinus sp.]
MDLELMVRSAPAIAAGLPMTLGLVVLSLLIGFVLAVVIAQMRLSRYPVLSRFAAGYVFVIRGGPLLLQFYFIYYGLSQFRPFWEGIGAWPVLREAFWCAVIALALNTAAYTSEIIRGGILSVPHGSVEAARACGMSRLLVFRRIVLPIAFRQALPAYGNEVILMVKATSLASIITIMEMTGIAKKLISQTFAVYEVFIVAGAIYLLINFLLTRVVKYAEWRLTPYLRERPAPASTAAAP